MTNLSHFGHLRLAGMLQATPYSPRESAGSLECEPTLAKYSR